MDPVVVKAFINLLGLYPVGTLVVLDTFELGIVHAVNPNSEMMSRPIVRVVSDPQGNILFPGTLVHLSEANTAGTFVRTIIKDCRSGPLRHPGIGLLRVTNPLPSLTERFAALRANRRRALICYLTAGFPDESTTVDLMQGLADAGTDVIELGIPFSDPLADGPVIQASSQRALAGGMTYDRALRLIERARVPVPVIIFS